MKRKFLSLILVFAMTVSLLTVGTGAVEPTYGDTADHWAESSIERWSAYGIIQGSNGLFAPDGQLTCAQLATILAKLLKLPAAKDAGFSDNKADAWYYDAINRCTAAGILNGNGDGTVTPEAPIARERAMVMLARALGIEPLRNPDLTRYTDAAQVSAYAQGYVAALIEAGIVGGVTADELAPQDNINRASTVTILDRAISTYADKAGATVKADGKGIVLVVADDVTVTGNVDKLLVPADNVDVTVSGSKNIDDITVTGDNSKVILNNSTANDVTLDGKNTELETKSGSKVENVSVTEDAKGATVNAGSGTTIGTVDSKADNVSISGDGKVENASVSGDNTKVNTKDTKVDVDEGVTGTTAGGKEVAGGTTTETKPSTPSGGGPSHGHSYVYTDNGDGTHTGRCYANDSTLAPEAHNIVDGMCTVCGAAQTAESVASVKAADGTCTYYSTLLEAVAAGGDVTLLDNVVVSEPVIVNKTVILNMNGKTIRNTTDIWNEATGAWSLISVRNGGDLTITGNGKLQAKANDCFAVDVQGGAKLTIENGTFVGNIHAVYVYQGELTVKGGTYSIQQLYSSEKPYEYVLNCYDDHRTDGTAKIIVTGGTFEKFNPANCAAEGAGTNFVAAGYTAKKLEGDKYQVVALFASGTGTAKDPFTVATDEQLKAFAADVNGGADYAGKIIKLTADIDLAGKEWAPIGTAEHPFSGTFDGNNKTISNLKITTGNYAGLFGYVSTATIKNVKLANAQVSGGERMASLIGRITDDATVTNCSNDAASSVTGSDSNTGGLIGEIVNGTVELSNLVNNAAVKNTKKSNSRAGGVVAQVTTGANVTLTNCTNNGAVNTNNGYAGGIVSAYQSGTLNIANCVNRGTLVGAYEGNMLGWYTSIRSITISSATNEFDINAIGCIDIATTSDMSLYGKHYFVNKKADLTGVGTTAQTFSEIFAEGKIGTSPRELWDKLIAFYAFAAKTNSNFAGYPKDYWSMFNQSVGYSEPDWDTYFNGYNDKCEAEGRTADKLTKEEFNHATWREKIVYLAP